MERPYLASEEEKNGKKKSYSTKLLLQTVATGYMTMMITQQFNTESVLLALIITTLSCGTIIIFAMQTKYDLTK